MLIFRGRDWRFLGKETPSIWPGSSSDCRFPLPSGGNWPPRCIRMWCCSTTALVNLRWQSGHEFWPRALAGRALCVARWALRLPFVEKERPQSLQGNGRSPKWVAWWRRNALGQLRTRRHTPHWLGTKEKAVDPWSSWLASSPLGFGFSPRAAIISLL